MPSLRPPPFLSIKLLGAFHQVVRYHWAITLLVSFAAAGQKLKFMYRFTTISIHNIHGPEERGCGWLVREVGF